MTRLGALLGWKNRFRCRRPRVDLYKGLWPKEAAVAGRGEAGATHRLSFGCQETMVGGWSYPRREFWGRSLVLASDLAVGLLCKHLAEGTRGIWVRGFCQSSRCFNLAFLFSSFFFFFNLFAPNHTQGDQAQCLSFLPSCLLLDP